MYNCHSWGILRQVSRRHATSQFRSWITQRFYTSQNESYAKAAKISKPLRILFCGSDDFSSSSLRALRDEQIQNPDLIASIDVLCRPGKLSGRSLKTIREVPIKAVAQELGLPVHERDTFTGWNLPEPQNELINLIISVSFGLFVPSRILRNAEYGGLNVHPSLLPNFRGPAPLQHTIMSGAQQCGVTLQTLDDKSFDHGIILAQTPRPGLPIPSGNKCTYFELLNFIKPIAASMLVQGLRDRVFVPPLHDVGWLKHMKKSTASENAKLTKIIHAPKITPADKQIQWRANAVNVDRRYRALGRLWTEVQFDPDTKRRIFFEDIELVPTPEPILQLLEREKGVRRGRLVVGEEKRRVLRFMVLSPEKELGDLRARFFVVDGDAIIISCRHGGLRVKQITVEGKAKRDARKVFERLEEWDKWKILRDDFRVIVKRQEEMDFDSATEEGVRTVYETASDSEIREPVDAPSEKVVDSVIGEGVDTASEKGSRQPGL